MKRLILVLLAACGSGDSKKAAPDAGVVAGDVGPVTPAGADRAGGNVLLAVDDTRWVIGTEALVDLAVEAPGYQAALTTRGVRLGQVPAGSIAARVGLASGDVIAALANAPVRRMNDLQDAWLALRRDGAMTFTFERAGVRSDRRVFLAERMPGGARVLTPPGPIDPLAEALIDALRTGVHAGDPVGELDPAVLTALQEPGLLYASLRSTITGDHGVRVTQASPMIALGLTVWDLITRVGDRDVIGPDDFMPSLAAPSTELALTILRVEDELTLRFKLVPGLVDQAAVDAALAALRDRDAQRAADLAARPTDGLTSDDLRSFVRIIDPEHYEVDQALFDKVLANPLAFAKGARVVPSVKNNQPAGFKLYAIRPTSVFAALGLANGDTIHAVNGQPLLTVADVPDLDAIKRSRKFILDITRRGKEVQVEYVVK